MKQARPRHQNYTKHSDFQELGNAISLGDIKLSNFLTVMGRALI